MEHRFKVASDAVHEPVGLGLEEDAAKPVVVHRAVHAQVAVGMHKVEKRLGLGQRKKAAQLDHKGRFELLLILESDRATTPDPGTPWPPPCLGA